MSPGMPIYGISHKIPYRVLPLWRRWFCSRNWHAWDEVYSPAREPGEQHYLSCDACSLMLVLKRVETKWL